MGGGSSKADDNSNINMETKQFIESENAAHNVVIYSKAYCGYCSRTKSLFAKHNITTQVYELDTMSNGNSIQQTLTQMTGQRTVPMVFVKNTFIGGNDDTHSAFSNGTISKLLK